MTERRHEQPVGVPGIDGDLRNLLRVAQAQMRPRLPRISGLVDAVADGEIRARSPSPLPT
jgi:hypothetical protein